MSKQKIEVDYWENEMFRPIHGGWSTPIQALAYHYSDISGKVPISIENVTKMDPLLLPPGWAWETGWEVDTIGKFGQVDAEGWSYSSSFDSLMESSLSRSLRAERKISNVWRRRRWIRYRVCGSDDVQHHFTAKVLWVEQICSCITDVIKKNALNYSILLNYKDNRRKSGDSIVSSADDILRETISMLKTLRKKLSAMKQFLHEKAAIEYQYASKLELLAKKWVYAGATPGTSSSDSNRRFSIDEPTESLRSSMTYPSIGRLSDQFLNSTTGVDAIEMDGTEDSSSSKGQNGFFHTVSKANYTISERLKEFSQMLTGSLYADIDIIIGDVNEALNECTREGHNLRTKFVTHFKKAEQTFELLRHSLERFQEEMLLDIEDLTSSVTHQCAATTISTQNKPEQTANNRFSLDSGGLLTSPKRTTHSTEEADSAVYFIPSDAIQPKATAADSDIVTHQSHENNPLLTVDMWLAVQQYRIDVLAADSALLIYNAFAKSQLNRRSKTASMLAEFLKSTLKVFANEQFRVWQDSATMLEAVGVSTNMVLVHSDVGDDTPQQSSEDQPSETIDLSSDDSDLYVGSRSTGTSKHNYEKNLNLIMIQAAGTSANNSDTSDSNNTENVISLSPFKPSVYSDNQNGFETNDSELPIYGSSPSTSNEPFNSKLSVSVFADHANLLPIAFCGLLRYLVIPHSDSSRHSMAGIATLDHRKLTLGLVILTYNRVLHVLRTDMMYNGETPPYSNDLDGSIPLDSIDLSSINATHIVLSANVKNVHVSSVFIPKDGFRDAFEIVFPFKNQPTPTSPSILTSTSQVSSIVLVAESWIQVRNWMRKISNAFVDPNVDPPTDFFADADFAQAPPEVSNGRNLLVVGDYTEEEEGDDSDDGFDDVIGGEERDNVDVNSNTTSSSASRGVSIHPVIQL